jgi:Flp pilus assembly protein TadD
MNARRSVIGVLVMAAAVSCRPDDQRTDSLDPDRAMQTREELPAEVVAQLDSGSTAFRSNDFEAALAHYTRVTEVAPDVGAGWFGVYMAQDALGNAEAARDALERAQSLVPGATLIHHDDSGGVR